MNWIVAAVLGVIVGAALTGWAVVWLMRTRMVVARRSGRSFEETCEAIERVVGAAKGWGFPIPAWNFYGRFLEKGCVPEGFRKIKVYFVCNTKLASGVLQDTPPMAGIMPCSWAVYELEDGSVWLSKMNIGLMAKMFSGVIRRAMQQVEEADEQFLSEVLKPGTATPAGAPRNLDSETS